MTQQLWQQFLQSSSSTAPSATADASLAEIQQALTSGLNGEVLCDLSHYGLIRASGADTATFLQNQFANDVRLVNASTSQLNAYCTPKGRALAFFRLWLRDDAYYLRLPNAILEPTLKRLRMYVLMSKVVLENASDQLLRIGYSGPQAEARLRDHIASVPVTVDQVLHANGLTLIRLPGPQPRFEIYGELEPMQRLWTALATQARRVGADSWELLDIHSGLPEVVPETVEAFVPQMINLQAINALSFKKGCYPGQEIVARLHYLGKLKRRMYLCHSDAGTVPAPGSPLLATDVEPRQSVGEVVRAQANPAGGVDLLAVIEVAAAGNRPIAAENAPQALMIFRDLPYMVADTNPDQT